MSKFINGAKLSDDKHEIAQYVSLYHLEKKYFEAGSMREIISGSLDAISREWIDKLIVNIAGGDINKLSAMQEKFRRP